MDEQEKQSGQGVDDRFDASQYAFFGGDVSQEVELGGLDDEDDDVDQLNGLEEEDVFSTGVDRDEIGSLDVSSEVEAGDLASSFAKISTGDSEDRHAGIESELNEHELELLGVNVQEFPSNLELYEQHSWGKNQFIGIEEERKQWLAQQKQLDSEALRSASYQRWGREGSEAQNMQFNAPKSQGWSGQATGSPTGGQGATGLGLGGSHFRQPFPNLPVSHSMMPYANVGLSSMIPGGGLVRHHLSPQGSLLQPQAVHQRPPQVGFRSVALPYGQIHSQQQGFGLPMGSQQQQKVDGSNLMDYRSRQAHRAEAPYPARKENAPQIRSKYMSAEEIETILRIQWTATHSSDPYIEDYYHQAVQAKQTGGTPHGRRHFAPSHLRDLPSHARSAAEPHAHLQVEALGRIPYSSIRRPRPLLEVDDAVNNSSPSDRAVDAAANQRRLEQEPMLVARIAIEDGICLLLDVDDIDRMLSMSQPPDGGVQLRRRRQILLEDLAASLQLADPLAPGSGGRERFGLAAKDDLVFLRLVSLPKGRKLVARYLRLLVPGSELVRIVAMAVFRHLRFLFGGAQSDSTSATAGLAEAVAATIMNMDLASLSACLAAVVLAVEPPPLRPIGSPSGDGATIILQAVLDRATAILTDRNVQYVQNTTVWQASFDAFFGLLSKYCTRKYESIMHSLMMSSAGNPAAINSAAAAAMTREMPIELLKASLPHTNDQQRGVLLELAQRSIVSGMHSSGVNEGHTTNTAAVRG